MEDALAHFTVTGYICKDAEVLILVLMEDALAHNKKKSGRRSKKRLNPCFNGRCTRTAKLG